MNFEVDNVTVEFQEELLSSDVDKTTKHHCIEEGIHKSGIEQNTTFNAAPNPPQVIIIDPKKPAQYKIIFGPMGNYLYSERWVPVQVAINNLRPGMELSASVRYKALSQQNNAVNACHEHSNMTPAESKGMDLRTPNKAAFALMAGSSRVVKYDFDGLHPTVIVPLNTGIDFLNLVFLCYSSCKPHKNGGNLMLLHVNIHDDTGLIVSSSEVTVRVAANVRSRADKKYEEDMLGKFTPRRPAKRPREDEGGDVHDVVDHPGGNQGGEGQDDPSDVVAMADIIMSLECDSFFKEAIDLMRADGQAGASSSSLATNDNRNIMSGTGSASNQLPLSEAVHSTNKSMVNIGAHNLSVSMGNNQTSVAPCKNNSAKTVVNQNQAPPIGHFLGSSKSLGSIDYPTGSFQAYVPDAADFSVTGLKDPERDCPKIKQYIESLGASCSQKQVIADQIIY